MPIPPSADWNRTVNMKERLASDPRYEEPDAVAREGFFHGYPIIAHDTPVDGGIYLGGGSREAIFVDSVHKPELLEIWRQVLNRTSHVGRTGPKAEEAFLGVISELVKEILPYPLGGQRDIERALIDTYGPQAPYGDLPVPITFFVSKKIGVCRHKALLDAYLVEKAIKSRYLAGKVSVDRNSVPGYGGHAWRRFTNPNKVVYIGDSAIGYWGKLADVPPNSWPYERPGLGDKLQRRGL